MVGSVIETGEQQKGASGPTSSARVPMFPPFVHSQQSPNKFLGQWGGPNGRQASCKRYIIVLSARAFPAREENAIFYTSSFFSPFRVPRHELFPPRRSFIYSLECLLTVLRVRFIHCLPACPAFFVLPTVFRGQSPTRVLLDVT